MQVYKLLWMPMLCKIPFVLFNNCPFLTLPLYTDNSIKPGILVLVNDCDWELVDAGNAILKDGDVVSFISTLHGG